MHDFTADLRKLAKDCLPGAPLMGLDLGTKTIGLAISDVEWRFATPVHTIKRRKFRQDVEALFKTASDLGVGGFVIGLPLNMDGSEGPRAQSTRAFVRNLMALTALPIAYRDERLSTVAAERTLIEADLSRAKRAKHIDAAAAGFILQGALDGLANLPPLSETTEQN
ncbi:MAG: Holliday junction resolvase RuvX [Pseudomonadota bacterium]